MAQSEVSRAWAAQPEDNATVGEQRALTLALQNLRTDVQRVYADLKGVSHEALPEIRERLRATLEQAEAELHRVKGNTESYISENPLRAVTISGAAGILLGLLLARR